MKITPKLAAENLLEVISASEINALLDSGATLVTANQRLSRFRLQAFEKEQIQAHKKAWSTPFIHPWQTWLQHQWQALNHGIWLSTQQESLLWRACVLEDELTQVLNAKALSKQAMEAWKTLSDYHISPSCLEHAGEEYLALFRWAGAVQDKLQQRQSSTPWFQHHEILPYLCAQPVQHDTSTILFDGFDTFSPAQLAYIQHLIAAGSNIYTTCADTSIADLSLQTYPDEEQEVRQVCQRIRSLAMQHPDDTIGIFTPNLEQHANALNRIFSEELSPALSLEYNKELQGDYFNISLGSVLAKQPMIQSAFALLSLTIKPKLSYQDITTLLLSPYVIGHHEEATARAQWDVVLRQQNNHALTLQQFLESGHSHKKSIPIFHQHFQDIHDQMRLTRDFSGHNRLSHWVMFAESLLGHFQWHEQADCPAAFAQVQNWRDLIQQLTTLDDFCERISWSEAIGRLQEYAFEHLFRPAPGQPNIQIMGLLEAANLRFDHAFIIGMDDQAWPAAAKPHPLIPVDIQVQHQTPHANSEREWSFAQAVWQHILHIAPTLHISYAMLRDKQEMQASSLLHGLKATEAELHPSSRYACSLQQQAAPLQDIEDLAVTVSPSEDIKGGTGLLKSQSACAFQAFAKYRLHLNTIETPTNGLNSSEQGILVHKALEIFWNKTKSQRNLHVLIEQNHLTDEINSCLQQAWHSLKRPIPFNIQMLESKRIAKLLEQWLALECQRSAFEVQHSEVWRDITVGTKETLNLHTKIDRIDSDTHGHHIILDYKTGKVSPAKALGNRPDEPQLPSYFLAEQALGIDTHAVAFAQVKNFDSGFKGFAQNTDILPQMKAFKGKKNQPQDWEELTAEWKETLDDLADAFMIGDASVEPKSSQSCTYCAFAGICRYHTNP